MTLIEQLELCEQKTIGFDGVQQSYREAGQGKNLVILHGISSGSGSWIKQLQGLSQHFHIVAWDAPGYAQSDQLKTNQPNAIDYAVRLKAMLDALDLKDIILLGHSLGALQATAFNALYPQYVDQLVIANVAQGYKGFNAQIQQDVFEKRPQMLKTLGAVGMAKSRGPHLVAQATPEVLQLIELVMSEISLVGFSNASYLLAYDSIQSYLKEGQVNTHLIMGMSDGITPAKDIQTLADHYQLNQVYPIENAGHLSYLDQAEQFNKILLSLNKTQM